MKEKLINNLGLKILSVLLAFLVWFTVVNVSNPEVTRTREVTLEIENGQILTDAGRTYEVSGKSTVTVSFDVRTRDEYRVRASDFRAYIDLSELYDVTGSVEVQVEVLNNRELISNAVARPGVVHVDTEELQSKQFELAVTTSGTPETDYALNGVTLNPTYVLVEGPISQVGLISYVGVEINVDGLSANAEGVVEPAYYDANGNPLELSGRVTVNTSEIGYEVVVDRVKNVPLSFEVSGTPASGYRFTGAECSVQTVALIGLRSSLATISQITIPASVLNISGAAQEQHVTVDLRQYLPEGVSLVSSEASQVDVTLKVEPLVSREISLTEADIMRENETEGLRYRLIPTRIAVTVQGLQEDLDSLQAADLGAVVDLEGMTEGTNSGSLTFTRSEVYEVLSYDEFQVEVSGQMQMGHGPAMTTSEVQTSFGESESATESSANTANSAETEQESSAEASTESVGTTETQM